MGKTSLCISVAEKLHSKIDLNSSVVLIQAEAIKKYIAEHSLVDKRIESVFQIYEIYALCQDFDHTFDKSTFELAFLTGNIIVIIDGLDEFVSMYSELFDLDKFLSSLDEMHRELGNSAVLLTIRQDSLIDLGKLRNLNIKKYELLGFDNQNCERYLKRRFKKYSSSSVLVNKVLSKLDKVKLKDKDKRIVPFFADIVATVIEDSFVDGKDEELEISEAPTSYPSANDFTDHIVYSVLRREEMKQELDISVDDVVQLILGLVAEYPRRWHESEMYERLTLLYDSRATVLFSKIALNPLLVRMDEYIEFRYSFLSSYFLVVYLLDRFLSRSIEKEFIRSMASLSTDSNEFKELVKYFNGDKERLKKSSRELMSRILEILRKENVDVHSREGGYNVKDLRRAIAFILSLVSRFMGGSNSHITEMVCYLYGKEKKDGIQLQISNLYIRGDFPPMDFTELTIVDSEFHKYKNLLSSRFEKATFMCCVFHECYDRSVKNAGLDSKNIDHTCKIGDLQDFIEDKKDGRRGELRQLQQETRRFLGSFYRSGGFIDNNKIHVKFSRKAHCLSEKKFDKLLFRNYIVLSATKEIDDFYTVSEWFRQSVRRFLNDNYIDSSMRNFFSYLNEL